MKIFKLSEYIKESLDINNSLEDIKSLFHEWVDLDTEGNNSIDVGFVLSNSNGVTSVMWNDRKHFSYGINFTIKKGQGLSGPFDRISNYELNPYTQIVRLVDSKKDILLADYNIDMYCGDHNYVQLRLTTKKEMYTQEQLIDLKKLKIEMSSFSDGLSLPFGLNIKDIENGVAINLTEANFKTIYKDIVDEIEVGSVIWEKFNLYSDNKSNIWLTFK